MKLNEILLEKKRQASIEPDYVEAEIDDSEREEKWEKTKIPGLIEQLRKCSEYVDNNLSMMKLGKFLIHRTNSKSFLWPSSNPFSKSLHTYVKLNNDRTPRDSSQSAHDAMNRYFVKKFGKPLRSCSLFAARNARDTNFVNQGMYGMPVIIIPANGYQLTSSPMISDLYSELTEHYNTVGMEKIRRNLSDISAKLAKKSSLHKGTRAFFGMISSNLLDLHKVYPNEAKKVLHRVMFENYAGSDLVDGFGLNSANGEIIMASTGLLSSNDVSEKELKDALSKLGKDLESDMEAITVEMLEVLKYTQTKKLSELHTPATFSEIMISGKSVLAIPYEYKPYLMKAVKQL